MSVDAMAATSADPFTGAAAHDRCTLHTYSPSWTQTATGDVAHQKSALMLSLLVQFGDVSRPRDAIEKLLLCFALLQSVSLV